MKTNYTKVEEALKEGMQKYSLHKLLDEADEAQNVKKESSPDENLTKQKTVISIQRAVKSYSKVDKKFYKKIGYKREDIKNLLSNPDCSQPEVWKNILQLKEKIEAYKKADPSLNFEEDIVKKERVKHVNKRYNVKDNWLPLH